MEQICRCSRCGGRFKIDVRHAGRRVKCPKCNEITVVPVESAPEERARVANHDSMDTAVTAPDFPELQELTEPTPASGIKIQVETTERRPLVTSAAKPVRGTKKRPASPLVVVIVVGAIALALSVATICVIAVWYTKDTTVAKAPAGETALAIDWPEAERREAALTLDGKRRAVPSSGPIAIALAPGAHQLVLQRRGYEMLEFGFELKAGERKSYQPRWTALAAPKVDSVPPGNTKPGGTNVPESGTPVGGPVGFGGWLQSLEAAQRQASRLRKDILMVFAGSDWSQASMDMTEQVFSTPEFRSFAEARFVLLVIDLPRTAAAYNQVENSAQNRELAERFLIRQLPATVLLDAEGRPYAIDGAFDEGVEKYIQHLNRLHSYHNKRNDLFAAAASRSLPDDQRLARAESAVVWLREQHLLRYYPRELSLWYQLADAIDGKNERGQLEVFFEADWLVRLANAVIDRKSEPVKRQLSNLLSWSRDHKFTDPDRGVRLHLAAFQLLAGMRADDDAARHVEVASTYAPKDATLKRELNDARRAVAGNNQLSSGTAFVVDARGYLLTNYHVIEGPGKPVVRLPGKQETVPVEIVDRDEQRDIALLKVDPSAFDRLVPLLLTVNKIKRAASVAVFGFPLGDDIGREIRITTGVVSALPDQSEDRMLLLDCRVNPGNSGGPVLQRDGQVVGMITAKTGGGVGVDSYGMALPTSDLVEFLVRKLPEYMSNESSAAGTVREWEQIDEQVTAGNSVLMVLKLRN